jgi:hypothetical protein
VFEECRCCTLNSAKRAPDEIDAELRPLAAVGRPICDQGGEPSSLQVDELLEERGLDSDG